MRIEGRNIIWQMAIQHGLNWQGYANEEAGLSALSDVVHVSYLHHIARAYIGNRNWNAFSTREILKALLVLDMTLYEDYDEPLFTSLYPAELIIIYFIGIASAQLASKIDPLTKSQELYQENFATSNFKISISLFVNLQDLVPNAVALLLIRMCFPNQLGAEFLQRLANYSILRDQVFHVDKRFWEIFCSERPSLETMGIFWLFMLYPEESCTRFLTDYADIKYSELQVITEAVAWCHRLYPDGGRISEKSQKKLHQKTWALQGVDALDLYSLLCLQALYMRLPLVSDYRQILNTVTDILSPVTMYYELLNKNTAIGAAFHYMSFDGLFRFEEQEFSNTLEYTFSLVIAYAQYQEHDISRFFLLLRPVELLLIRLVLCFIELEKMTTLSQLDIGLFKGMVGKIDTILAQRQRDYTVEELFVLQQRTRDINEYNNEDFVGFLEPYLRLSKNPTMQGLLSILLYSFYPNAAKQADISEHLSAVLKGVLQSLDAMVCRYFQVSLAKLHEVLWPLTIKEPLKAPLTLNEISFFAPRNRVDEGKDKGIIDANSIRF